MIKLPLATETRQTLEEYRHFSSKQRIAAIGAMAITLSRPLLRAYFDRYRPPQGAQPSRKALFLIGHIAFDALDRVDGELVRATDATTVGGAVLDPLADKVDFALQERRRAQDGSLHPATPLVRLGRDIVSSCARHYASSKGAEARAGWHGKATTALRSASLRVSDMYPDSKAAKIVEHATTTALLLSAASNIKRYTSK